MAINKNQVDQRVADDRLQGRSNVWFLGDQMASRIRPAIYGLC